MTVRRRAAAATLVVFMGSLPAVGTQAADLPSLAPRTVPDPGLSPYARAGETFSRADLRPVTRDWIVADAATVTEASELVVLTPDEAAADALIATAEPLGYAALRRHRLAGLGQTLLVLRIRDGRTGPAAIAEIEALSDAATAGVNHAYRVPASARAMERFDYSHNMLGWPARGCPALVKVGLVDTAIAPSAAQSLDATIIARDFRRDRAAQAGTEHGTMLAVLLAGDGRLLAPALYNAVVAGDGGTLDVAAGVDDLLRALDWLAGEEVRVANVSLAGPYNKILDLGIQAAAASGLVIVAAAGNDGPDSIPRFPAAFEEVIAVTAVDADAKVYRSAVRGSHIDFAAPGVDVAVPLDGRLQFHSGTSVAAPFVTALLAADPKIKGRGDPADIVEEYGHHARDVGQAGRDAVYGFGIPSVGGECP